VKVKWGKIDFDIDYLLLFRLDQLISSINKYPANDNPANENPANENPANENPANENPVMKILKKKKKPADETQIQLIINATRIPHQKDFPSQYRFRYSSH
jgi:hypothetical protein